MSKGGVDARFDFVNFDALYERLGAELVAATRAGLQEAGDRLVARLEELTPVGVGGPDSLSGNWVVRTVDRRSRIGQEVVIANKSPHAVYAEYGRAPGKQPPYEAIRDWAYAKGIIDVRPDDPKYDGRERKTRAAPIKVGILVSAGRKRAARALPSARSGGGRIRAKQGNSDDSDTEADKRARGLVFGIMRKIGNEGTEGAHVLSQHAEELRAIAIETIRTCLAEELGGAF